MTPYASSRMRTHSTESYQPLPHSFPHTLVQESEDIPGNTAGESLRERV